MQYSSIKFQASIQIFFTFLWHEIGIPCIEWPHSPRVMQKFLSRVLHWDILKCVYGLANHEHPSYSLWFVCIGHPECNASCFHKVLPASTRPSCYNFGLKPLLLKVTKFYLLFGILASGRIKRSLRQRPQIISIFIWTLRLLFFWEFFFQIE